MEELESSRQSRLRAWEALQKFRATLSDLAGIAIPPPPRKTFEAEGKVLNDALRRTLQERNAALRNVHTAVKKFEPYLQHSDLRGSEYAHALQDLKKALGQANELLQPKMGSLHQTEKTPAKHRGYPVATPKGRKGRKRCWATRWAVRQVQSPVRLMCSQPTGER